MDYDQEDTREYRVVKSIKGYISIWLAYKEVPKGWNEVGKTGVKAECLKYIKENFPENPDMETYKNFHHMK